MKTEIDRKVCKITYVKETFQDFFDRAGHQTTNASIKNKHFFTK